MVLGGAHAQEEQRLGHGVEDEQEHARPHGRRRADTGAGDDEAEVGDGGVGKHALGVGLGDGDERAHEERGGAHKHHGDAHGIEHGRVAARGEVGPHEGRQANQQEDAGLDHRGRVQKGTRGRGRNHGAEQPGMEGHLGGLGERRKSKQGQRQHGEAGRGAATAHEGAELEGVHLRAHVNEGKRERDTAEHVHPDLAERVGRGLRRLGVADEEERADGGDFPHREHPHQVVEEHEAEHGGEEGEHHREEDRLAIGRRLLALSGELVLMMLEVAHVAAGVHDDAAADDAHDEHHDGAERVDIDRTQHVHAVRDAELKHAHRDGLDACECQHAHAAGVDGTPGNVGGEQQVDGEAHPIEPRHAIPVVRARAPEMGGRQGDAGDDDDGGRNVHDRLAHPASRGQQTKNCRHQRDEDEQADDTHVASTLE